MSLAYFCRLSRTEIVMLVKEGMVISSMQNELPESAV